MSKKALKSVKAHIEEKDFEAALYESTELLKGLDPKQAESGHALVFRGLALTNLNRKDEAEKCYLQAHKLHPTNPLAGVGLRKLYEKGEAWDKLGRFLEMLVQDAYDQNNAEQCASALQDLLELRSKYGPPEALYRTLDLLLPSSPLVPFLQALSAPQGSYTPFPSPIYPPASFAVLPSIPKTLPHALHLLSSLPLLLNLLIRAQGLVYQDVETKVKAARMRLGAGTEKEVRRKVEAEVLGGPLGMKMIDLLREVGGHSSVDEAVRRDVEVKEFEFWRKLVAALSLEVKSQPKGAASNKSAKASAVKGTKPSMISSGKSSMISSGPPKSTPAEEKDDDSLLPRPDLFKSRLAKPPTKDEALARADSLANGFVLLGVSSPGSEEGWLWVIEGKDEPTLYYDVDLLHKFAHSFPDAPLTDFIDDYCRWFRLPLPEPEEEAPVDTATPVENRDTSKNAKKPRYRKAKAGLNARDRRKARRLAGKEGVLNEDLDREEREELIADMTKLLDKLPRSIFAHRVMARISIEEEDWANAISFAEKGRALVKELVTERGVSMQHVQSSMDTTLGVALVPYFPPKHHTRASRLLKGVIAVDAANAEARFSQAQILETAGKWSEARLEFQAILDQGGNEKEMVAAREEVGWCLVNEGNLESGRDILEEVVEMRDSRWEQGGEKEDEALPRARAWWRLGQTEWMIGDQESRQHAEEWYMASARALPTYAPAYSGLGNCYLGATPPDTDRALKCFQKAFELDATEADAARLLAEGYADDDEWALVRAIANRVMEGEGGVEGVAGGEVMNAKGRFAPKNGWAWKALGSTEMHYHKYAKAAQAYQIALRADPDDVSIWIQLGEAYVRSGRHTAGLKTLQHALELDPEAWNAEYDIGDIHLQLGQYELATKAFEKVRQMTGSHDVGVTAKMADAMLALGRQTAAGGFRERSRNAFHGAITLAGEVLKMELGHRPWAWKIIGDATFELSGQESTLADAGSSADMIIPVLQLLIANDTDRRSAVDGLGHAANLLQSPIDLDYTITASVYALAYRAYLLKNETRVYDPALYDLASALHVLARRSAAEKKKSCMKAAIGAIRSALERDAGDERLWNALGVLAVDGGEEVAQHAFVVSLELYGKDPIVWSNLGYLYLKLDDRDLASQCFNKSQVLDPDYAQAWLGQGLLADRNGDKDHAKALFAHSVTLSAGALLEADLAQAVAAFLPLVNASTDVSLLHGPAFALRHYIHQRPRDVSALHLYALICERLGLVDEAATSLESAVTQLEEDFEASESSEIERTYTIALVNLGRVRLAGANYADALEAFTNAWELVSSNAEMEGVVSQLKLQSRLGQGLAHFWLDDVESSLSAFQAALDVSGDGLLAGKDEVAVILARTLWGLGGEDARETAKTHLMECLSHDTPPINVINTLAAIALVSSDADLLDASISELQTLSPERVATEDPTGKLALVLSTHALNRDNLDEAVTALERAYHTSPMEGTSRNRLAKLLISAGRVEDAISLLSFDSGTRQSVGITSETLRLKGLAKVLNGDSAGLSELNAAVRVCPWDEKAWEGLAWAKTALAEVEEEGGEDGQVEGQAVE